jgi:hypothetical protein
LTHGVIVPLDQARHIIAQKNVGVIAQGGYTSTDEDRVVVWFGRVLLASTTTMGASPSAGQAPLLHKRE